MYNLDKKQKIILSIIIAIIIGFIFYYVYAKDKTENTNFSNELEIENVTDANETKEQYNDEFIVVHISGAVNKEGVIELKTDSRISDAIEKARRN